MKILHVNEHYGSLGGAERYVSELCAGQLRSGWEPVVVASPCSGALGDATPVKQLALEPSYGLRSSRRAAITLRRILDEERPDVVHLHNVHYFLGPAMVRLIRSHGPAVATVHDTRTVCPRWQSKILPGRAALCAYPMGPHCFLHGCYPFHDPPGNLAGNLQKFALVGWSLALLRDLDRIFAPSSYMRDQLRLNGFPEARLEVLPPFPNGDFGTPARLRDARLVVYAGRVDETKGIRPFLECLARLPAGDWRAEIAGDGPLLEPARDLAAKLGLAARVKFRGHLSTADLAGTLRRARVLVMPSLAPESFGLSGLEALASGVPVVAFDSGGIAEWLEDGVGGYRVPRGDVAALARRVGQLLADDALAERLGRQGREHTARFDRERHVARLGAVYAEVTRSRA